MCDREPDQRVHHVLLVVPAGQRRDDRGLGARHAVSEQREDVRRDALDHGVDVGRAGEGGGLGARHVGPVGQPKVQRQSGRNRRLSPTLQVGRGQ